MHWVMPHNRPGPVTPKFSALCQPADVLPPRFHPLLFDERFANVVENEIHLGTLLNQLKRVGELLVALEADLKVHLKFRQRLHAPHKIRPETKTGIALKLDDPADAFDQFVPRQRGQLLPHRVAFLQWRPRHDADDARVLPGEFGHPIRLSPVLRRVALALQKNHPLNWNPVRRLPVVLQQMRLVQGRDILQPRVPNLTRVPNMQMRIHHRDVIHFAKYPPSTTTSVPVM
jgi:hypothetical protein